jgi:hypothetical protein
MTIVSATAVFLAMLAGVSGQGDYFKSRQYIHPGKPGPWISATRGQVWPKPKLVKENGGRFSTLNPDTFTFHVSLRARKPDEKFIYLFSFKSTTENVLT